MAIINLGQVGPPRESVLSGVADQAEDWSKNQQLKAREKASAKAQAEQLLAKYKFEDKKRDSEHLRGAIQNYSNLSEDKQQLFKDSDGYKELVKLAKRVDPELLNEDGEIAILPREKNVQSPEEAAEMQVEVKSAIAKMQSQLPLTVGEANGVINAARIMQDDFGVPSEQLMPMIEYAGKFLTNKATGALSTPVGDGDYPEDVNAVAPGFPHPTERTGVSSNPLSKSLKGTRAYNPNDPLNLYK